MTLNMPLMDNNITKQDLNTLIKFLKTDPILTQSKNVVAFEEEWSKWLGVKYSVFVNSGSSANFLSIAALKTLCCGAGEIIVPTLTWSSDISSVLLYGFTPVFVDINLKNLGMLESDILSKITSRTKAVFLTHVLGFNGLSKSLLSELNRRNIPLIEDVCEAHGAKLGKKKLGTFGLMSNFSFYYAHHMSTIEGGMVCTDNHQVYETVRMLRSHGMVREMTSQSMKNEYKRQNSDLNPQFIFAYPGFNMRSTELNAVIGRAQLKRLDRNNEKRRKNFELFLSLLDKDKYMTKFDTTGSVNYAFVLVLKYSNRVFAIRVMEALDSAKVEYRRGLSGGGNQLRQPYLKEYRPLTLSLDKEYPNIEHVHFHGFYLGNFPTMKKKKIIDLCKLLNSIK